MKIRLLIVILGFAMCGNGAAFASNWCTPTKTPSINVRVSSDPVSYNFSQSEKNLNKFNVSTINPYGENVITDVGGLMKGGIKTQQKMSFGTITNQKTNQVCLWHDQIDVTLHINPTIYVASDFKRGTCMHNSILEHEHKHVMVDREIVNKYASLIGKALQGDVNRYNVFGPYNANQQNQALEMVKTRMQTILTNHTTAMSNERRKRQQAVDSLAEYERVNKSCPK